MTSSVLANKNTHAIAGLDALSSYLRKTSGFALSEEKGYLVESKVMPIVTREKLSGLPELITLIERGNKPELADEVIQAMTVNETYFFRDKVPFDTFREIMLPKLIAARRTGKAIRVWSAACSTGQEAYSLAMIANELARPAGVRVEFIATDISEKIIAKAKAGVYNSFDIQRGLPENYLRKYFNPVKNQWQISSAIREYVTFKKFNLLDDYAPLGLFDVVFCRNVLIYFDTARKKDIMRRIEKLMAKDGYLVLGAAESLLGITSDYTQDRANQFFTIATSSTP